MKFRDCSSSDPMDWDEEDAAAMSCEKCGERYQVVRPGKIQPSCDCEYMAKLYAKIERYEAALKRIAEPSDQIVPVFVRNIARRALEEA